MTTELFSEIIETNEISAFQKYVAQDSLVLFNVTGTLYEPATMLADRQWREHIAERVKALVPDATAANQLINKMKNIVVNRIPKKGIEKETPQLITNLQNRKIAALGITQKQMETPYAKNFGLITRNHLLNIGINFERTLTYFKVRSPLDLDGYSFAYGLIFTNKKPVGPAIVTFLNQMERAPSNVILVDNSRDNIESAEAALVAKNIKFEGFRYGRADQHKNNFDPVIGNIEFFAFINNRKILSDQDARQIQRNNPTVDYNKLLDNYILDQTKQK
jgi:hypothetical protein